MEWEEQGVPARIEEARVCCEQSLRSDELAHVAAVADEIGMNRADFISLVNHTYYPLHTHEPVKALKAKLEPLGVTQDGSVERFLLIHAALESLHKIPDLPVASEVKHLICDEFIAFAYPVPADIAMLQAGKASFTTSCRVATLQRFPAGQLHWEISGLPRSWLFKPKLRALPRVWTFVALRLHGLKPTFSTHLAWRRKNRLTITETEQQRSYYLMAQSLALQPRVRGLVTDSWFYSPDTYRVSPHLAWLNRFFVENGGLVEVMGPADPTSGYLDGSIKRRRLYEAGEFKPTTAVVMWPRKAMLHWAARHPELGDNPEHEALAPRAVGQQNLQTPASTG